MCGCAKRKSFKPAAKRKISPSVCKERYEEIVRLETTSLELIKNNPTDNLLKNYRKLLTSFRRNIQTKCPEEDVLSNIKTYIDEYL